MNKDPLTSPLCSLSSEKLSLSNCIFNFGSLSEREKKLTLFFQHLANHYTSFVLITDQNLKTLYGKLFTGLLEDCKKPFFEIVLDAGEKSKTLLTANSCWSQMVENGIDRNACIIAFGGGVITDLAGFVASCYMRGIDYVSIPTTLLAMVDASIGGKTAVNLPHGKNLVGAFHLPKQIFLSPSFLQTLPEREYRAGLAEVIKYGVVKDPLLFEFLEKNMDSILKKASDEINTVLYRCSAIKSKIVLEDPEDRKGVRAALNWGHTFGHALEAATGYNTFLHGEAVAIGMSIAARVSVCLGYACPEFPAKQDRLIHLAGLKTKFSDFSLKKLIPFIFADKKTTAKTIHLIIAKRVGEVFKLSHIDCKRLEEILI